MKIFKEIQRFNQWWFIAIQSLVLLLVVFQFVEDFQQISDGTSQNSVGLLVFNLLLVLLVFLFLNRIKLKSKIDESGISYQFFPIHSKYRHVPWSDLSKCYVRKYNPILEYGGWGLRGIRKKALFGLRGNGRAYNIKGTMGIQLEFKDGGKLLIGTQDPEKARMTINNYIEKMDRSSVG